MRVYCPECGAAVEFEPRPTAVSVAWRGRDGWLRVRLEDATPAHECQEET